MERVLEPGGDYIFSRFETHTLEELLMSEGRRRSGSGVKERKGNCDQDVIYERTKKKKEKKKRGPHSARNKIR